MKLEIRREPYGDWSIIKLEGGFAGTARDQFIEILEPCLNDSSPKVALDLSKLIFVDSSAIGLMIHYSDKLKENNGILATFNPNASIADILEMTGFSRVVKTYMDYDDFKNAAD